MMSNLEKEKFLEDNPHIEQIPPDAINIGDSVRLGVKKPPADFQKYVLDKIKEKHPRHKMGQSKFGTTREI